MCSEKEIDFLVAKEEAAELKVRGLREVFMAVDRRELHIRTAFPRERCLPDNCSHDAGRAISSTINLRVERIF